MSIGKVFALFLLRTVAVAAATCGGHGTQESLIVSTGWLANHMKDANLVVLAVGDRSDYDAEHIAGSQFIEYRSVGVKGVSGLTLELPPTGGHAGFAVGPFPGNHRWLPKRLVSFFRRGE